jgi:hypothetical protein
MFHRYRPRQALDADCICIANALAEQEADATSAVYLWCVAACNMDVLIALP